MNVPHDTYEAVPDSSGSILPERSYITIVPKFVGEFYYLVLKYVILWSTNFYVAF